MSANYQTSGHASAPILGPDGNPLSGVGPSTAEPSAAAQSLVAPSDAAAEAAAVSATSAVSPADAPESVTTAVMPAAGPSMVAAQMSPLVQGVPLVMPQGFAPHQRGKAPGQGCPVSASGGRDELVHGSEPLALAFQGLVLAGLETGPVELLELKAKEVGAFGRRALVGR